MLLGGCALVLTGCLGRTGVAAGSGPQRYPLGVTRYPVAERVPLPTLSALTLTGRTGSTARPEGAALVLNVWASWCEPCRSESPVVARAARRWAASGVRFVGLDENDSAPAATDFARSVGFDHPQLVDDGVLLRRLSTWLPDALPGTLLVDRQGRVAARVVGPVTADQLEGLLHEVTGP